MNSFTSLSKTCVTAMVAGFVLACAFGVPAQGIPLPVIPDATFNVTNYGAVGDGRTMNTAAIQKTVDAASAAGGGTVLVPAGKFLTGPFTLASSINLHLARDAFILISDEMTNYPFANKRYQDSISASGAHDLEISGEGTIDGQGNAWWTARAMPGWNVESQRMPSQGRGSIQHTVEQRLQGPSLQERPAAVDQGQACRPDRTSTR